MIRIGKIIFPEVTNRAKSFSSLIAHSVVGWAMVLVLFGTSGCFLSPQNDKSDTSGRDNTACSRGVRNGIPQNVNEFPSTVSISFESSFICSGVLLSPTLVLTAAHCMRESDNGDLAPAASYAAKNGIEVDVISFEIHPKYTGLFPPITEFTGLNFTQPTGSNLQLFVSSPDLAILKLGQPLFSGPFVPLNNIPLIPEQRGTVVGFGGEGDGIRVKLSGEVEFLAPMPTFSFVEPVIGGGGGPSGYSPRQRTNLSGWIE